MRVTELLPIGSVVLLRDGIKKIMIAGILQEVKRDNEIVESYDYIGVAFPEGLVTIDALLLFNHNQIMDVVFRGYDNSERKEFMELLSNRDAEKEPNI